MKYIITLMILSLACSQKNNSMEDKVHQFMKDSVVPTFNDPASYQFDNMDIDTVTGEVLSARVAKTISDDSTMLQNEYFQERMKLAQQINANPALKDSIYYINVRVDFRGKNKFGGLIKDKVRLVYYPATNTFERTN